MEIKKQPCGDFEKGVFELTHQPLNLIKAYQLQLAFKLPLNISSQIGLNAQQSASQ
ncbi:hypothetical protein QZQ06_03760 [Serratia marcescens]|nr:hypothetical protein [Serratia marcescens]MDP8648819.1 hypothetical protein [Serratia marcescens]MDP8663672.1 hypothetical protein [Serratia marcescens]MDP8737803.1 hypothetical protein [Serratia marcescens]MDP8812289.1 hypothetical protein [Serratia marcescens]HEI9922360.1 hypothetical protein [Serratia marcescens]